MIQERERVKYRRFGKLDWQASALGFGCMRFPTRGDAGEIDEPEATRMLHWAIDHGVNYLDTAYPYHDGKSESLLGRALQGGYRERVRLATKLPAWEVESTGDFDRIFNEQLEKLQTDYVDFYLLHALNGTSWKKLSDMGIIDWAESQVRAGRANHLGFSFHDDLDVFKCIIDAYDGWTLCQMQYNYMDVENQAGTEGLRYAAAKGLAVIIMEPLLGGKLVNPPEPIERLWDRAVVKRAAPEWALQWLWSQPEVSVVLSGMSAMEQVRDNVASAELSELGLLTQDELALISEIRDRYSELCPIPCTACRYCMPCPNGVDIPRNFGIFNQGRMYDKVDSARADYAWMAEAQRLGIAAEDGRAKSCVQCKECEPKCPQQIRISEWMVHVHNVLGKDMSYDACLLGDEEIR
jgi:predicted aldo/keto reductase-like oxidoreductase